MVDAGVPSIDLAGKLLSSISRKQKLVRENGSDGAELIHVQQQWVKNAAFFSS